ncbi:MAG: RdgB/HAM1 family non-canonical purine NTP pyrophosphatase [Candidatus Latescibacterota bacterium]|nr:MAG: RdgB/HAM1 family non-canonical purine NTP pyrophosphatase [Candidatus Latescibacterota bacterium]
MNPRQLFIATRNPHKLREIAALLADLEFELRSGVDASDAPEVVEDGVTLEANASKKARELCTWSGLRTLADDSGLEVDALGGAPGVLSARYAGVGCSFADNNRKLLEALAAVADERRTARFRCVMALATPRGERAGSGPEGTAPCDIELFEGRIEGRITRSPRGAGGFGYDPVFYVHTQACTLAEMEPERKNRISHRARALAAVRQHLLSEWPGRG